MGVITGTNDSETLIGTTGDDFISPLLGNDIVDGAGGSDTLVVDYRSRTLAAIQNTNIVNGEQGHFSGSLDVITDSVKYQSVEAIQFSGGSGNDSLYVSLDQQTDKLILDAGGGFDTLTIDTSKLSDFRFILNDDQTISSDLGAYSDWEAFRIVTPLGGSAVRGSGNSEIVTGQQDDLIYLGRGRHLIDAGGGNDRINIQGSGVLDGGSGRDSFTLSDTAGPLTAQVSGTGVRTSDLQVSNVEDITLGGTDGSDAITTDMRSGGDQYFFGAGGVDRISVDLSGQAGFERYSVFTFDTAGLAASLYAEDITTSALNSKLEIQSFEELSFKFNDSNNNVFVLGDEIPVIGTSSISIDGGLGVDNLTIFGLSKDTLVQDVGNSKTNIMSPLVSATGHNIIALANFEFVQFDDITLVLNGYNQGGQFVDYRGHDRLAGTEFADEIVGLAGNDTLCGNAGNDILNGGAGNDIMNGGDGSDTVSYIDATRGVRVNLALTTAQYTNEGKDTLISIENVTGSAFADGLRGDGNSNVLNGGLGDDILNGGDGIDTASYIDATRGVRVNLALTTAQYTNEGKDTLISIENVTGSAFADGLRGDGNANVLNGGLGNDNLFGFGGADWLIGGDGSDRLDGGNGADTLRGGLGRDILTGGAGADTYVLDTLTAALQPDTIIGFVSGDDKIALSQSIFAAFVSDPLGALSGSAFHIGTKATSVGNHLIYNSATGALFYDSDGLGCVAQIQIAQLTAHPTLAASDIMLF